MKRVLRVSSEWFFIASVAVLLLMVATKSHAQDRQVVGKIIANSDNKPIPGVNIRIKGTNRGTTSDASGEYKINVPEKAILDFSNVGFTSKEIEVGSKSKIDVILSENVVELQEMVVTALGIKKEQRTLTSAVQSVKGEDLVKAREPNIINSLVGKVAGLTIGASAELLGRPNIVLRGNTDVLFVVDGVPINSDTWNISADDIETYSVLKGATASALYGFRGKNGAILITTKRGSKDKRGFSVEFNSSTMVENGFNAIPKTQDLYGPGDHGQYSFVDGRGGGLNDGDYDIWGPKFNGQLIPQYDSPVVNGVRQGTPWVARGKDNLSRFLRSGVLTTNNIAVSSSTESTDLRFSLSHNFQQGIVPNTQLNAFNFNTSISHRFSKNVVFDANINYNRQATPNIPDVVYGPNSVIYNMTIWGGADWNVDDMKNYWQAGKEGTQQIYAEYQRYNNPYFTAYEWLRSHYKNDIYGQAALTYKINDNLEITGRTAVTTYGVLRTEKFPYSATVYGREEAKGDYREDRRELFENNTDILIKYSKNFGPDFSLKVWAGGNLRTMKYASSYATTDYLNVPGLYNFSNSARPVKVFNYNADMDVLSAYYSADLSYKGYLNLSLTGRMDRLSTLPTNNNSFFYPSVGLNTVISDYANLPEVISFLKLRASYASVKDGLTSSTIGSTPGASYPLGYGSNYNSSYDGPSYRNSVGYSTPPTYNNNPAAYYSNTLNNADLKPNTTEQIEAGLELNLYKNRIGLDITYFVSNDGPRIFGRQLSDATGYSNAIVNGIKTQKTGWEISLKGSPIKNLNGFSWDVTANWSTYKETLQEIFGNLTELPSNYFVGGNDGNIPLKIGDRIDPVIIGSFARTPDGKIINDAGGRPLVLPRGQFQGYANPDWVWAINNKFSYKNWTLGIQFDGRVGGVIENYIRRQTFRGGRHIETVEGALGIARESDTQGVKAYVGEGVKIATGSPKYDPVTGVITNYNELTFTTNDIKTYAQDYISRFNSTPEGNLMSKTFGKIREITLGYTIPTSILKKTFIRQATVSFVGRNLFYFVDSKHNDVDLDQFTGLTNRTDLQTPTLKRYGVNINITF